MSGFDFGSLRDPDAPRPDSYHRDAVEARAHELRAKSRRNRTILSALAIVVVIAAVSGIVATRPDKDEVIVRNSTTTTTPQSSIDGRFIPPTTVDDGMVTLPVTLPNGETLTLRYPQAMQIAQLGLGGSTVSVNWEVETAIPFLCCSKEVGITYQTIEDAYGDATPVHVYRGPNGEAVPYFHARQALTFWSNADKYDFLVFQFGPWLVQVYDQTASTYAQGGKDATEARMTEAQRETWARSLTGTVDDNGYLLLHAAEPLSIGDEFQGTFGGSEAEPNRLWLRAHSPLECEKQESETSVRQRFETQDGPGVSWCAGDLHLEATGSKSFVDLAAADLQVSGPITNSHSSINGRFIPSTTIDRCGVGANCTYSERVAMPVTLPDGERFTLLYPKELEVAQLGFAGSVGVNWPVDNDAPTCCSRYVSITYETIADVYGDATPAHVYRGPNGESVPYFDADQALKPLNPKADSLVFQFGPWLVQVYNVVEAGEFEDRMTDAQLATWARSLTGSVDSNGYLLLHATAPLSIGNEFSGSFGATPGNALELAAHIECGRPESHTSVHSRFDDPSGTGVAWCAGDLHLSATGKKAFIDLADDQLKVSGPITGATSTTSSAVTQP